MRRDPDTADTDAGDATLTLVLAVVAAATIGFAIGDLVRRKSLRPEPVPSIAYCPDPGGPPGGYGPCRFVKWEGSL